MRFLVGVILACLIASAVLPVPQVGAQETITVVDAMGNKVELPYPVERIACFSPQAAEVIVALEAGDKIVGIDSFTKWTPEFYPTLKDKPLIGMIPPMPYYEKIIGLKPQVVIAYADPLFNYPYLEDTMRSAGIKTVRLDLYKPTTFAREAGILGQMLGKEDLAKEYLDFALSYAKKIEERLKDIPPEERVRVYYEWFMPYIAYGEGTGGYQLIEMAGGWTSLAGKGGKCSRCLDIALSRLPSPLAIP
jgi:iron complex transport system substrate-binding protein